MTNEEVHLLLTNWCNDLANALQQVETMLQPIETVNIVGDPDLSFPSTQPLHEMLDDWRAQVATLTDER
jgi:hypothetical protein